MALGSSCARSSGGIPPSRRSSTSAKSTKNRTRLPPGDAVRRARTRPSPDADDRRQHEEGDSDPVLGTLLWDVLHRSLVHARGLAPRQHFHGLFGHVHHDLGALALLQRVEKPADLSARRRRGPREEPRDRRRRTRRSRRARSRRSAEPLLHEGRLEDEGRPLRRLDSDLPVLMDGAPPWDLAEKSARYRLRRPPPPPPPPGPPRLPPPPPSLLGRASLTVSARPDMSLPFRPEMAAWASASLANSTKPKPLERPGVPVRDHGDGLHRAVLREQVAQLGLARAVGEIADVKFHEIASGLERPTLGDVSDARPAEAPSRLLAGRSEFAGRGL